MNTTEHNLSLYFHFPFCEKKCNYCDFYSTKSNSRAITKYIDAMSLELLNYNDILKNSSVISIYCGGGTPSLLSIEQWEYFTEKILLNINYDSNVEFTIECNPESYSSEKANAWLESGVNRLSVGVQSFDNEELELMGRVHNSERVFEVFKDKTLNKFNSVSGDLIFGTPNQSIESLKKSLTTLFSFNAITHFSSYELTIAPKTNFDKNRSKLNLPLEDDIEEMSRLISNLSEKYGFHQYEISNFAKDGYECKHNKSYWNYSNYIGFGAGAHSFYNSERFWNIADTNEYINLLTNGENPVDSTEKISGESLVFELLFLGLRTTRGIDINWFEEKTKSIFFTKKRSAVVKKLVLEKLLVRNGNFLSPTKRGVLFADGIVQMLV